jgi:RiboL-PSP-HEPN
MAETNQTIIDQQYINGNLLVDYLKSQLQLTFYSEAENSFRKTILLSSASFFEKEITDTVIKFAESHTGNNKLVVSIIRQKVVSRQYHTYFDWNSSNANTFFGLFGDEFKNKMSQKVKDDEKLDKAIKAFIEIGRERNKMVHQNFAEIVIDKTADEIYKLYQSSLYFIQIVKRELIKEENIREET